MLSNKLFQRAAAAGVLVLGGIAVLSSAPVAALLPDHILTGHKADGMVFTVSNQILHPWGRQSLIAGRPIEIAVDSAGAKLAVLNSNRVDIFDTAADQLLGSMNIRSASYGGVAFRPASDEVWASECLRPGRNVTTGDAIAIASIDGKGKPGAVSHITFEGRAVPAGIAFTPDGLTAYVALNKRNTVAVVDAKEKKVLREIPVSMAPFGVTIAKGKVFVTNRGGRAPKPGDTTSAGVSLPMVTDPVSGSTVSGTVSVIDIASGAVKEIPVGLSPSLLSSSPDGGTVAVANSHGDSITFLDTTQLTTNTVSVPAWPESTVGSLPVGVTFSPDGTKLYVACAGTNALAVLSKQGAKWAVAGAFPTGWFPSAVVADPKGIVHLVTIKGEGNTDTPQGHRSTRWEGSLETFSSPTLDQAKAGMEEVRRLNEPHFSGPEGITNLKSLGIQHVILVVKENRTYDQLLGDLPQGNGEPKYLQFGKDVTPNTHALAEQFVLLDNFYTSGAISFDGHQWLMMGFVSDQTEKAFAANPRSYSWHMGDSLGVSPAGFFWQGAQKPVSLRIYGEFCVGPDSDMGHGDLSEPINTALKGSWAERMKQWKEGTLPRRDFCASAVPAMEPYLDRKFNAEIGTTDQFKTDEYLREFADYEKSGNLPQLSVVTLNNDHTNGTRPGSGTPRAMVADNDLALGRLVERVSKSKYWEHTLILVTEDDAQAGLDHVDGHRTICLAIGPHVKRGVVDSANYNHLGMVRTMQEIFGVPSRTRAEKAARLMGTIFTTKADLKPFQHVEPKIDITETNPELKALNGPALRAAKQSIAMDFSGDDRAPSETLNRIIWWSVKGFDVPYPGR